MSQDAVTADVFRYLSKEVLPYIAAVNLQATSLSIILNAFAKAEIRDDEAIGRLCSMIVAQDSLLLQGGIGGIPVDQFDGRHIASVFHAVATLHVEVFFFLDSVLHALATIEVYMYLFRLVRGGYVPVLSCALSLCVCVCVCVCVYIRARPILALPGCEHRWCGSDEGMSHLRSNRRRWQT
jgi:hypothetical protein